MKNKIAIDTEILFDYPFDSAIVKVQKTQCSSLDECENIALQALKRNFLKIQGLDIREFHLLKEHWKS